MEVVASIVLGADGSTSLNGDSLALSTPADRARFLARRRTCDVIIIGGNTAKAESYRRTPAPLVILSHKRPELLDENSKAHWWQMEPKSAVARALQEFGPVVGIEGGITMVEELLADAVITTLELTVTPVVGGEKKANLQKILSAFEKVERSEVDETIFYTCTVPIKNWK